MVEMAPLQQRHHSLFYETETAAAAQILEEKGAIHSSPEKSSLVGCGDGCERKKIVLVARESRKVSMPLTLNGGTWLKLSSRLHGAKVHS